MRSLALALILGWFALAHAADLSQPQMLVAKPELHDPVYGASILVVRPVGDGRHIGFIVNRPMPVHLGDLFPGHGPSQKVIEPVYLGGPVGLEAIFALVRRADSPGGESIEVFPGLYAVFDAPTVDRMIEKEADHTRFVAGLVVWRPGELAAEIEEGAWFVLPPDAATALRSPRGLWDELVHRSVQEKSSI